MTYDVIIIDDEAWTRDTIKRIGKWEEYGFQIVGEMEDGISGIEGIKTLKPHLVVTDMKMPGLDGAELLRLMTENQIKSKIIVVSGYYDYNYTRQAINSNVMDYLLKPINEEELNKLIARCAKELKEEDSMDLEEDSIVGNVSTSWFNKYVMIRDDLRQFMSALAGKAVNITFEQLEDHIHKQKNLEAALGVRIKLNYDLLRIMEETMIKKDLAAYFKDVIKPLSYAISEKDTVHQLINHYHDLAQGIIAQAIKQEQEKTKIDINDTVQYINNHFQENITLSQLAEQQFISKEYLSALFKKSMGKTFTEYLTQIRMEKAEELITIHNLPIKKVAESIGYTDLPHFYKTFKKYFYITPGEMRDQKNIK